MGEAFELGGENHVHEDRGEQHRKQKIPGRFFEDFDLAGEAVGIACGEADLFDGLDGVGGGEVEGIAAGNVGVDGDFEFAVVAPERGGTGAADNARDIFEADLAEFGGGHHHLREDVRIVALALKELHDDGILLGAFFEAGDFVFAGIEEADGVANVGHADADVGGALAVDFDLELGGVEVEAGIDVDEIRILMHEVGDLLADVGELVEFRTPYDRAYGKVSLATEDGREADV